jgi:nucleotide-binding universal stress UspA family protein
VDFSEGARGALAEAESLARRFDAELVLLHVAELPAGSDIPPPASVVEATRRELAATLETWRRAAEASVGRPVEAVLLDGPAAPGIARAAAARKLDLLVTATHGRRGFRHLVLGSVAERLVHLAPCSVLVFRS